MNNTKYITILCCIPSIALSIDNPHFYRATNNIFNEPRIEHIHLSSFDATIAGGSTDKSFNENHHTVPLFDLYGPSFLTIDDALVPVSTHGTFSIVEANLSFAHNLNHGFLLFFHLPIRNLRIKHPFFTNDTEENQQEFNILVKNTLLNKGIIAEFTQEVGVGDFSTLVGWTHNYQETKVLDFIDGTVAAGVLFPTGKKRNNHELFSLPLGYNKHWGFPINIMLALGTCEWITLGCYAHALFFINNTTCMPIQTSPEQSGLIKTDFSNVTVHQGPIWNTGLYFKADHFGYGFSFTALYSYAGEGKNILSAHNSIFDCTIANFDPTLKGWDMHTLHFNAEYDFAQQDSKIGTRIGIFYTQQLQGKRTFKTNMTGGSFGLEIGWRM